MFRHIRSAAGIGHRSTADRTAFPGSGAGLAHDIGFGVITIGEQCASGRFDVAEIFPLGDHGFIVARQAHYYSPCLGNAASMEKWPYAYFNNNMYQIETKLSFLMLAQINGPSN
ncbi:MULTISPECIES: hypothetical protein [unclassified Sphingopyxis]|uniref:hypothetical protein n=1 Tax=unclassified Sphingopyxis TaxID=2614943 RepID=UPI0012E35A9F|nr:MULTISPECIES: hypothetical protein [unclassified Sphingopyxis]